MTSLFHLLTKVLIVSLFIQNGLASIEVTLKNNEHSRHLTDFHLSNSSEMPLYCRKIEARNIDYYDDQNEYVYTLNSKIMNQSLHAQEKKVVTERLGQELSNILRRYTYLQPQYSYADVQVDCESGNSRLNNLYVVDDRRSCSGDIVVKEFVLDNGKSALIEKKNSSLKLSENAVVYELLELNEFFIINENQAFVYNFSQNEMNPVEIDTTKELILGVTSVSQEKFIVLSGSADGVVIRLYSLKEAKLELVDTLKTEIGALRIPETKNIINREELVALYEDDHQNVLSSLSIYLKREKNFESVTLQLSYLNPTFYTAPAIWDFKIQKYTKNRAHYISTFSNRRATNTRIELGIAKGLVVFHKNEVTMKDFREAVKKQSFIEILPTDKSTSYLDYKLELSDSNLVLKEREIVKDQVDLCKPLKVFSDRMVEFEQRSIDDRYNGQTMISMAVRSQNYDEALRLISLGASVNVSDVRRKTPLDYALMSKNLEMTKLLIENGSRISTSDYRDLESTYLKLFFDTSYMERSEVQEMKTFFQFILESVQKYERDKYKKSLIESLIIKTQEV